MKTKFEAHFNFEHMPQDGSSRMQEAARILRAALERLEADANQDMTLGTFKDSRGNIVGQFACVTRDD